MNNLEFLNCLLPKFCFYWENDRNHTAQTLISIVIASKFPKEPNSTYAILASPIYKNYKTLDTTCVLQSPKNKRLPSK